MIWTLIIFWLVGRMRVYLGWLGNQKERCQWACAYRKQNFSNNRLYTDVLDCICNGRAILAK